MGWLVLALVVVAVISFYTFRDWRRGTGSFEGYGPASSVAQRKPIDEGRRLCSQGLYQLFRARSSARDAAATTRDAVATLSRSAALGNARAKTGLGLAAYFSGDLAAAHSLWLDVKYSDDSAGLLYKIATREDADVLEAAARAFLRSAADQNAYTRRIATEEFAEHARRNGFERLAAELTRRAAPRSYQ